MRALIVLLMIASCSKPAPGKDPDQLGREATAAMKQYNDQSKDVEHWFPELMSKLERKLLFDPAAAAKQLTDELLPKLDAYIATLDSAVTTAQLYLATGADVGSATADTIGKLRQRLTALHTARDAFAKIQLELGSGAMSADKVEQIAKDLASAGMALVASP